MYSLRQGVNIISGPRISTVVESNEPVENCLLEEDAELVSPDSPCFTTPGQSTRDSDEELSTNFEGTAHMDHFTLNVCLFSFAC